jgi:hypothetical protein
MSIDLEHEVRAYAEYLDEILPTVTADSLRTGIPVRPRPVAAPRPWYRRPVVVFVAAMAGVLAVAVAQLLLLDAPRTAVTAPPATTRPAPEVATTVPTTSQPDLEAITLVPTEVDPVQISTVVGDIEFTTWRFPPDQGFVPPGNPISTAHGLVFVHGDELSWSADYTTWYRVPIGFESQLATLAGDDIVVSGATNATRYGWDGARWAPQSRFELPSKIHSMAFGPRGAVAASATTIYYAPEEVTFFEAQRGPNLGVFIAAENVPEEDRDFADCRATFGATSAEIQTVVATDAGFVALTSATHRFGEICAPLLWFSTDGTTWDLVSPDSPFGELSQLVLEEPGLIIVGRNGRIVERAGRFVAIGEFGGQGITDPEGAVWVSDNALDWYRAERASAWPRGVFASELGWVLTGYEDERTGEDELALWFSTDGSIWDGPYEVSGGLERGDVIGWSNAGPDWFGVGKDTVVAFDFDGSQIAVIGRIRN